MAKTLAGKKMKYYQGRYQTEGSVDRQERERRRKLRVARMKKEGTYGKAKGSGVARDAEEYMRSIKRRKKELKAFAS